MNERGSNLVTTYTFKGGKEYIVKMNVTTFKGYQRSLELVVTDKHTAENWQSSYDVAYIENLTHKTGNYKQFDVFLAMLQSGLLKTSDCITLDLLTCEDLELLRPLRVKGNTATSLTNVSSNRRYLILTYTAEFDRIHYPLPLEYSGLPDATTLQATIRRLQAEIEKLRNTESIRELQKRIDQLRTVNRRLIEENQRLSNSITGKDLKRLLGSVKSLESTVAKERMSFQIQIHTLRSENAALTLKIQQLTEPGKRKPADGGPASKRQNSLLSLRTALSNHRKSRSRSPSVHKSPKMGNLSPASSSCSLRSGSSTYQNTRKIGKNVNNEIDLGNLESRIRRLQKMLKDGINLTQI